VTHMNEGHYAKKHADQVQLNQTIADVIRKRSVGGKVSCATAFRIVEELNVKPSEVGQNLDLLEMKIVKCQLGLFGYGGRNRLIAKPDESVPPELERALRVGLVNDRLPCATAWDIAKRFDLPKMSITSACEKLHIRIGKCQLGSFS
jgi:hypothetical protein